MPEISPPELLDFVERIFVAVGAPDRDAAMVAAHLVEANLVGHDSHGVVRVPRYIQLLTEGIVKPGSPVVVVRETDSTVLIDGGWNFGQVVARRLMQTAIEKARVSGVGVAVGFNLTHAGRMGAYAEQAVEAGLIGMVMANVHGGGRMVAPHGGAERRLATNPIAIGVPTNDQDSPFVLDMATSIAAEGKLRVAMNKGEQVPEGWLLDATGVPTRDPAALYEGGAILPVGGHKGFGLAMAVEALAGGLSPAGTSRPDATSGGNGLFMLALDPERFGGLGLLQVAMGGLVEWVTRPPFQPGFAEVLIPGQPERRQAEARALAIPLDDETWRQLTEVAERFGVEAPRGGGPPDDD